MEEAASAVPHIEQIRLTQHSHGGGCGCKISPALLDDVLHSLRSYAVSPRVLVGAGSQDDAAVYALSDTEALVSTTDFFTPIVDDPADFGGIAAVNAISDVYAMGGRPVFALAILGWPISKLPVSMAAEVMRGASEACVRAGISIVGGHSIDTLEPVFGLCVTGLVQRRNVRTNAMARPGSELYLTKPLGVGILTTAQKRGVLADKDLAGLRALMLTLNDIGPELAELPAVATMTDVTGFGLLGHLIEICEGSALSARLHGPSIPKIENLDQYVQAGTIPGGTLRNFESYGHKVATMSPVERAVFCDPQTSGGLLVAVDPAKREDFLSVARACSLNLVAFGALQARDSNEPLVTLVR